MYSKASRALPAIHLYGYAGHRRCVGGHRRDSSGIHQIFPRRADMDGTTHLGTDALAWRFRGTKAPSYSVAAAPSLNPSFFPIRIAGYYSEPLERRIHPDFRTPLFRAPFAREKGAQRPSKRTATATQFIVIHSVSLSGERLELRMSGIEDRHSSSDAPRMPETAPKRFRHTAVQFLLGIAGVALITYTGLQLGVQQIPPTRSVGPGTISLLYVIVVVFVAIRAGFVASVSISLIAVFCMSYFLLPLLPSLKAKNPFDIVATVVFLTTAWVISGMVARVRKLTEDQLALRSQVSSRLMEVQESERRHLARELHDEIGQFADGSPPIAETEWRLAG